jgi:hypothetical protein
MIRTLADLNRAQRRAHATNDEKDATSTRVPGSVNLGSETLRRKNMAGDWMAEHASDYANAAMLAQAASTKYDIQYDLIINQARIIKG